MSIGAKRHIITIQSRTNSQGSTGEVVRVWTDVLTRRAEFVEVPGREVWSSAERHARVPVVFKIRFPREVEVEPKMRLIHNSKVYDIVSAIDPDGLKVDMVITTELLVGETP